MEACSIKLKDMKDGRKVKTVCLLGFNCEYVIEKESRFERGGREGGREPLFRNLDQGHVSSPHLWHGDALRGGVTGAGWALCLGGGILQRPGPSPHTKPLHEAPG